MIKTQSRLIFWIALALANLQLLLFVLATNREGVWVPAVAGVASLVSAYLEYRNL